MSLADLSYEDRKLLDLFHEAKRMELRDPRSLNPNLLPPCRVRVLLVGDSDIDFSRTKFGLRAFVETLLDMPGSHVKFEITLGHLGGASGEQMMSGEPMIVARHPNFRFDNVNHFNPGLYDQVWLFGFSQTFSSRVPNNRLGDDELVALAEFMNGGGGLFATGDHGAIGAPLCAEVPRARSMRMWGPAANDPSSEVSMTHARRNDTNQPGPTSDTRFDDQSDDVPQPIAPKMYHRRWGVLNFAYPHPLLCGPAGIIRIMPDHPHEGECIEPTDPNDMIAWLTPPTPEYPPATVGGARPLPEVISTNSVLAGNTAEIDGSAPKTATEAHTFGGISAYDGHRADVGRVVTDATWHHFVNINLVGDKSLSDVDPKYWGFTATTAGRAHLAKIRTYYRNIATWLARPKQIRCIQRRLLWALLWDGRVMEAVMTRADLPLERLDAKILLDIGRHARDVLGQLVGACAAVTLILDEITSHVPREWRELIDPWSPNQPPEGWVDGNRVPWIEADLLLDIALGGAIAGVREAFPAPDPERLDGVEKGLDEASAKGVAHALGRALESFARTADRYAELFAALRRGQD
jgi:hypothetical protein